MYGYTTIATNMQPLDWRVKLAFTVLFFIPRANPDNEKMYPQIHRWLLEINHDGFPSREIGLDADGTPLFAAPDDHNVGFWGHSDKTFTAQELELTTREEFERLWAMVQKPTQA